MSAVATTTCSQARFHQQHLVGSAVRTPAYSVSCPTAAVKRRWQSAPDWNKCIRLRHTVRQLPLISGPCCGLKRTIQQFKAPSHRYWGAPGGGLSQWSAAFPSPVATLTMAAFGRNDATFANLTVSRRLPTIRCAPMRLPSCSVHPARRLSDVAGMALPGPTGGNQRCASAGRLRLYDRDLQRRALV